MSSSEGRKSFALVLFNRCGKGDVIIAKFEASLLNMLRNPDKDHSLVAMAEASSLLILFAV